MVETGGFLGLQWPGVAYLVRSRPMTDPDSNKRWEVLRDWQPRLSSDLHMNLYTDTQTHTSTPWITAQKRKQN